MGSGKADSGAGLLRNLKDPNTLPNMPEESKGICRDPGITEEVQMQSQNMITKLK